MLGGPIIDPREARLVTAVFVLVVLAGGSALVGALCYGAFQLAAAAWRGW